MAEIIRLKKGLDIPMKGAASAEVTRDTATELFGICPDDFPGIVWKLKVKPGETVNIGSPLMADKETGKICLVSPVSGKVVEVIRGERRHILAITVKKEGQQLQADIEGEDQIEKLCRSGLWALMRQRPFDIVPDPSVKPRDIFVTAFDSSPLAPEIIGKGDFDALEKGLAFLSSLTAGKVYLGTRFGHGINSSHADVKEYQGPHPAGNVGVQIAAVKPVNKGETVWALDARTVARIGTFVSSEKLDCTTKVAITGSEVKAPAMVETTVGASLKSLLNGKLKGDKDLRVISGNVLTGSREDPESGFLRYPYRQITVIEEGSDKEEILGWASVDPKRYSVKRSFPAFLRGLRKPYDFDARVKGGHRAMILSGEYDKVFPFDIYPEYLVKAAIAKDIDKMEKLGIYEVAPEDFALPEFVDTSNIPLQQIMRDALGYVRSES